MSTLPGLQISLLSPRPLELTPGSYSDLVQTTLGNMGDASDGTDALIGEAMAIQSALESEFPTLDAAVNELGDLSDLADESGIDGIDAGIFATQLFMDGVSAGLGALSSLFDSIGF